MKNNENVEFKIDEKNLNQIKLQEGNLIKQNSIIEIVNNINNDKKEYISIIIDSNLNDLHHAKAVSGIIDTNLKKYNIDEKVSTYFIPKNMDANIKDFISLGIQNGLTKSFVHNLTNLEYYEEISKIDKDKKVFINESFGDNPIFDIDDQLSLSDLNKFKSKLINYRDEANQTIKFLNENSNINLIKSAGNNVHKENRQLKEKIEIEYNELIDNKEYKIREIELVNNSLKKMFDKLTNNNYDKTSDLVLFLNKVIKTKLENNPLDIDLDIFLNDFKYLCSKKDIDFDQLIDLYLKDYLVHYDKLALLNSSKDLKNNNLHIVEAINYEKIKENIKDYKEYHKDEQSINKIEKLEKELIKLNIKDGYNYGKEDVSKIKELYEKYKEEFPEIFKYTNFGTFSSFIFHENNNKNFILKVSIDGHNSYNKEFRGTSASTPEYISDLINEIIQKDFEEQSYKNSFTR